MLAADDILVSLTGNRVVLTLDPAGAEITNLGTSYNAASGVLTITAASKGTISTAAPIVGISVDTKADTIAVNLKTLPKFAGLSVFGGAGTDSVTIGGGGVNLRTVTRGAASQGVSINTGAGTSDTITIAGPLVTKGAGAVNLATQGQSGAHGIQLASRLTAPTGSQTFNGAVTLQGDVDLRAGRGISFSSTVDGAGRLSLSAGGAITFAGDVGSNGPLKGLTLARASRVTVSQGLSLDGTGTAVGTSGLVIGKNVHNVVFSKRTVATSGRTISGFSDAGIRFLGGSWGSRITGVTSTGNGAGIRLGGGFYGRTVISGNVFNENVGAGVSLVGAQGVRIGVNEILRNGTFGITAAGVCQGSIVVSSGAAGDGNHPLGQIQNYTNSRIVGTTVIQNKTGLRLPLTGFYLAQKAVATADWYFPTQSNAQVAANGVIWLQRADLHKASSFAALAKELARQTNSIVVAPKFRSLDTPGPSVSGENLGVGVAQLFVGDRLALNRSATAAGYQGPLPQQFLLAGLGKGGGFATSVGGYAVDNGDAVGLLGVVMVDGFADADQFKASVAKLDSLGIPTYQIADPPSASNAWGRTTDLLAQLHPGQFVGIETPLGAHAAAITASVGWINDIYAGYGPTNPKFGIYGNPNDGTYVAGQRFTIAGVSVTVLYATTSATPTNMALIPAGSFEMGNTLSASNDGDTDELPVHTVSVREFYMDKYEVSKALWDEVASWAGSHGYDINTGSASGKATNHPVYNVTWHEAVKWSNARSQKEGLTPCYTLDGTVVMRTGTSDPECNFLANGYRLPTEAEWEKAARGGLRGKRFPWGDTITHSEANYESSSYSYDVSPTSGYHPTYATGSFPYSSPVGSFPPNAYGLYDVAGNMDEWCWDSYSLSYYATSPELNPTGPALGDDRGRVRRGGSWTSSARYARAADRDVLNPGIGYDYLGFRCVRSSDP